jgi:hypothetical protein
MPGRSCAQYQNFGGSDSSAFVCCRFKNADYRNPHTADDGFQAMVRVLLAMRAKAVPLASKRFSGEDAFLRVGGRSGSSNPLWIA